MSSLEIQDAQLFIATVDDAILTGCNEIHGPTSTICFLGTFADVSPATCWKSLEKLGVDNDLNKIATSILSAAAFSGGFRRQLFTVGMNSGTHRSDLSVQNCCEKPIK